MAARKSQTPDELRKKMEQAGIYEERFEFQIQETAEIIDELAKTKGIIQKEGRVINQETYGNANTTLIKKVEHPLLPHYRALHKDLPNHLAALGLNRLSEKKSEPKPNKAEKDPAADWFNAIR